jgi:hypothetical protein
MSNLVHWHGDIIPADKLIRHYRAMAHRQPNSARFWRGLCRQVVAACREQSEMRRAA